MRVSRGQSTRDPGLASYIYPASGVISVYIYLNLVESAKMNGPITIQSNKELDECESIIFDAVVEQDLKIHVLPSGHTCNTDGIFTDFIENKNPSYRCIMTSPGMLEEFIALHLILKGHVA